MEELPRERPGIGVQAIGATGYIGAQVARELLRAGYTLIGPVRARPPRRLGALARELICAAERAGGASVPRRAPDPGAGGRNRRPCADAGPVRTPRRRPASPAAAGLLSVPGRLFPSLADKAEFARIGHYYATESMLLWDQRRQRYDADATPEFGEITLQDSYRAQLAGRSRQRLGAHRLFR